jgi:hypothetical protein
MQSAEILPEIPALAMRLQDIVCHASIAPKKSTQSLGSGRRLFLFDTFSGLDLAE